MTYEELAERIDALTREPGSWMIFPGGRLLLVGLPDGNICVLKGLWWPSHSDRIERRVRKFIRDLPRVSPPESP